MNIKNFLYQKITVCKAQLKYKRKISHIKKCLGNVNQFTRATVISAHTIVIVETNPFHAETLPGYIKYFLDLGYNVDVFLTYECVYEKPFERMAEAFRVFVGESAEIQRWIGYDNMKSYVFVFFSTLFYNNKVKFLPPLVCKDCIGRIFGVAHNLEAYKEWIGRTTSSNESRMIFNLMLNNRHFASLSKIEGLYFINPNYFGNVVEKHQKSIKTKFVTVGTRDCDLLVAAVRKLVDNQITDFVVQVIGNKALKIPYDLREYIILRGRLDFPSMYAEIEESDFILALLDPYNTNHQIYLEGTTSGSLQLSLGFLRPLVINSLFSKAYSLDSNSIVKYNDNNLYEAMLEAISMSAGRYNSIQDALKQKRSEIRNTSIESIKAILKRIS